MQTYAYIIFFMFNLECPIRSRLTIFNRGGLIFVTKKVFLHIIICLVSRKHIIIII